VVVLSTLDSYGIDKFSDQLIVMGSHKGGLVTFGPTLEEAAFHMRVMVQEDD
jgi:hypothetical protein